VTTLDEREVVTAIGCELRGHQAQRLTIEELDRAFREETRFHLPLLEILRIHLGRPVRTRAERAADAQAAWEGFQRAVWTAAGLPEMPPLASASEPAGLAARLARWLTEDAAYLRAAHQEDDVAVARAAGGVARAIAVLERSTAPLALPLLAQRALGHPHALDPDTLAGRLLERAIVHGWPEHGIVLPLAGTEERELLLASANIAIDDVSSGVHVYGLVGVHPVLAAARASGDILTLPLALVSRLTAAGAARGRAFVVENPAVFSTLVACVSALPTTQRPTLVCTSGQLSLAARKLLDLLFVSGAVVQYGGDFDHMGLAIARGVRLRGGERVRFWRMGADDYAMARARAAAVGAPASAVDHAKLVRFRTDFPDVADAIAAHGAAFQEALMEDLLHDLRTALAIV